MNIIYIVDYPFGLRDYNRLGVRILEDSGFKVHVWDLSPWLKPKVSQEVVIPDSIEFEGLRIIQDVGAFTKALALLKGKVAAICFISYHDATWRVFRELSKRKIPYGFFSANALPSGSDFPELKDKTSQNSSFSSTQFSKFLKRFRRSNLMNTSLYRLPKVVGIDPPRFVIAGGEKSFKNHYPVWQKASVWWIHTLDYDIYLDQWEKPLKEEKDVAVFLDEFVPFHPDYVYRGVTPPMGAEDYYPRLCRFFEMIESRWNVRVEIAAHPRSSYENGPKYFGNRKVVVGKTIEMVRRARFVIAHSSTAAHYAVLFDKPIVFITMDALENTPTGKFIHLFSHSLGKSPINLDQMQNISMEKELSIHRTAYARHRNDYIKKSGTPEVPAWQIVAQQLKSLLSREMEF